MKTKPMKPKVNKAQIRGMVEDHARSNYSYDVDTNYLTDLLAFQGKYPECYIEAWCPVDYENAAKKKINMSQAKVISSYLYNTCNADEGTSWKKIREALKKVFEE
jgi:hypothetical protein